MKHQILRDRKALRKIGKSISVNVIGIIVLLCALFPIIWLAITSFKSPGEIFDLPIRYLPREWTLENYTSLFTPSGRAQSALPYGRTLLNSLFVSASSVLIAASISAVAGYGFSRFKIKGKRFWLLALVVTRMLPGPAIMMPIYSMINRLGLMDSLFSLILIYSVFGLPFGIWLSKGFFDGIPIELEEAAVVDGCSRIGTFFRIVLPLCFIGLISVAIFLFLGAWSEFAFASILVGPKDLRTATVTLAEFVYIFEGDQFSRVGAASVLMSVPVVLLFFSIQKQFVRGFYAGAVKG